MTPSEPSPWREKNPDSSLWKWIELVVQGKATREEMDKFRQGEIADKVANPATKAMLNAQILWASGKTEEAINCLIQADKEAGAVTVLVEQILQYAMMLRKWDLAQQYLPRLEQSLSQPGERDMIVNIYRAKLQLGRGDAAGAADRRQAAPAAGEAPGSLAAPRAGLPGAGRMPDAIASYEQAPSSGPTPWTCCAVWSNATPRSVRPRTPGPPRPKPCACIPRTDGSLRRCAALKSSSAIRRR